MKNPKLKSKDLSLIFAILYFAFCISGVNAQSTRQEFPTPIINNEISGRVPARDIGDSRLTNYFYTFNGNQGDVFINVQTTNLNGDIDVFTADNLKSLTKITIYADISQNETGRVIYLRKPEKLILRIQGRTPNDDAATFHIKFAGSFQPMPETAENSAPELPEVKSEIQTDVRVNSVGTIIEVKPKPTPAPKETVAKIEKKPKNKKTKPVAENIENSVEEPKTVEETSANTKITIEKSAEEESFETEVVKESPEESQTDTSTKITITEEIVNKNADEEVKKEDAAEVSAKIEEKPVEETTESKPAVVKKPVRTRRGSAGRTIAKTTIPKPPAPDPLENIFLTVLLKNGTKIEHQMSDISRFNIIKGILTIIRKDGKIERYSILDIERTIIE